MTTVTEQAVFSGFSVLLAKVTRLQADTTSRQEAGARPWHLKKDFEGGGVHDEDLPEEG